jgi:hypothetical protein
MAQRDQVLGMFGASPEQIMARIRREQAQEVLRTQDPFQRAGGAIGMGLARMFGGEPAEVTRQRQLQQTLQGVDMENPEQMTQAARVLNQSGFSNEAMQLLSRADQFRTSAMDRERSQASIDLAGQQVEASKAEVARGLFERVDETISQPVTIDGQTYYVPVKAKVKYNKETGAREVLTSTSELEQMGQQAAQKMKREDLAAQSEATLRETQLTAAKKQATLADAQLTATQKKAGETTGLVRVPIQRDEFDPLTQRTKKVTGYEYKATTGTMTTDENGNEIFVPNMQLPPEAEVVDDKGLPQGAIEIERGRETTITNSSGQEFVKVGAGEEAKFYQVITEGDSVYYMPTPVDPGSILNQASEEEQTTQSNLGRKGQMSRGTTITERAVISSRPRTQRKR